MFIILKTNAAKYDFVVGDQLFVYNTSGWESYERLGSYPSSNNIIFLVIFVKKSQENLLQCWSTTDNPSNNLIKVTVKKAKNSWKVLCTVVSYF